MEAVVNASIRLPFGYNIGTQPALINTLKRFARKPLTRPSIDVLVSSMQVEQRSEAWRWGSRVASGRRRFALLKHFLMRLIVRQWPGCFP
jgi:hypothetical protein